MENTEVVKEFWERVEARDWEGAGACLADNFVADWPHSRERFRGRDNYIGMNRAYPEGWRIEVGRILGQGDVVVSEVRVPLGDQVSHVVAFFEVRNGRILRSTEYWVDEGEQDAPEWRKAFAEPTPKLMLAKPPASADDR